MGEQMGNCPTSLMTPYESCYSFVKFKLLLDELYDIFTKCGQNCSLCDKFILEFHQHVILTHANGMMPMRMHDITLVPSSVPVSVSIPTHVNHFPVMQEKLNSVVCNNVDSVRAPEVDQFCKQVFQKNSTNNILNGTAEKFSTPNAKNQQQHTGENFSTAKNQQVHTGEKDYIICRCCQMRFSVKLDYERHFHSVHTGEDPYKCETCGKCFTKSQNLTRHDVRSHTGEKSFKCFTCGRRFPTLTYLNKHMTRSHLVEKPYKCLSCGKTFQCPSDLTRHNLVHTGERPHKCDVCGMSFRQSTHLNKHKQQIHNHRSVDRVNEKQFRCGICGKSFSQSASLTAHKIVSHVGDKYFKCELCGNVFDTLDYLNKHRSLCHTAQTMGEKIQKCTTSTSGKGYRSSKF